MSERPHVFLFDADADGVASFYGAYFDRAFLNALSSADQRGETCSQIKRGDAMIAEIAGRVIAVNQASRGRGYTLAHDMPLYETLIWDLVDALAHQWHTLELDAAATIIANHSVHCIMLPDLRTTFRGKIDQELRPVTGYLGAFELDAGNPVQRRAFCDLLVYSAAVIDGQIVRDLSHEGEKVTPFEGAEAFQPKGAVWRKSGWLHRNGPPDLPKFKLSDRGAVTASLIARKRRHTIQDRVLQRLALALWSDASGHAYSFEQATGDGDILEAILPDGKFTNYLFNADHKDGRGKAKFFTEELGISPDDWRYLAAQFYEGLILSEPRDLDLKSWGKGYGAKFTAYIQIIGRNGETRTVKTVWMMEPGRRPHLSTAHPDSSAANPVTPESPPILPPQMRGNERWAALYALAFDAGDWAQANAIPTPLKLEGYPVILDGKCGRAGVTVKDVRTGFARWLIKSGHGDCHYRGGARVHYLHTSQSYDRAKAFAMAFARVLIWNGVPATVDAYYD